MHVYDVRPRKDHRGVDLFPMRCPFGRLWYLEVSDAIDYAKHRSRSHDDVIRIYDEAGNVIETSILLQPAQKPDVRLVDRVLPHLSLRLGRRL